MGRLPTIGCGPVLPAGRCAQGRDGPNGVPVRLTMRAPIGYE